MSDNKKFELTEDVMTSYLNGEQKNSKFHLDLLSPTLALVCKTLSSANIFAMGFYMGRYFAKKGEV